MQASANCKFRYHSFFSDYHSCEIIYLFCNLEINFFSEKGFTAPNKPTDTKKLDITSINIRNNDISYKTLFEVDINLYNKIDFRKSTLFVFSRVKSIIYTGNFLERVMTVHVRKKSIFMKNEEFPRNVLKSFFSKVFLIDKSAV